ncbi:MAG: TlpA disulfide reductase family protein [Cyclobacteriaceae bacterium]
MKNCAKLFGFILVVFHFNPHVLYAQNNEELLHFAINGSVNIDTGSVQLDLYYDTDYYASGTKKVVANIENGAFYMEGLIPYPQGFTLSSGDHYYTGIFIIEPGVQSMKCNIDSAGEIPVIENKAMTEFRTGYNTAFSPVRREIQLHKDKVQGLALHYENNIPHNIKLNLEMELRELYLKSDSSFLNYVSNNPRSYLAFWKFINLFGVIGYEPIYDSILEQFHDSLLDIHAGRVLIKKIKTSSSLTYGREFPKMNVVDIQDQPLNYGLFNEKKYTLLDFWFSGCHPCIAQFPHLKRIYEEYKHEGFEIVGISTDRLEYGKKWKSTIAKHELAWLQYWDKDGLECSSLSINKFPTNYLLDGQGKIIKKDLKPIELEQFLAEHLK